MSAVIHVRQLTKSYDDVRAVQGIDFEVQSGEIFAMLGPNGAGKSTTVEILEGLRPRDGGDVSVLDMDPPHDPHRLKSRIGVVLQQTVFPNKIRVSEVIDLYGRLYRSSEMDPDGIGIPAGHVLEIGAARYFAERRILTCEQP